MALFDALFAENMGSKPLLPYLVVAFSSASFCY